jgi:hypothetical protein
MAYWTPRLPARFGDLNPVYGLVFQCKSCGYHRAVPYEDALRAWGEQGVIAEVAARLKCGREPCRSRDKRGMRVDYTPLQVGFGRGWRQREEAKMNDAAKLLALIDRMKVRGKIS